MAFFIWSALPILIWGFLRYEQDGFAFFSKMISYDVIERSTKAIEGHAGGPLTYLEHLILHDFWVLYFLVGVFGVSRKGLAFRQFVFEQGERDLKIMVVLGILVPLILFSIVSSKLTWYINPIFPPLAILVGWSSYNILKDERNTGRFRAFVVFFALMVFVLTEGAILHRAIFVSKPEPQALLYEVKGKELLRGRDIYAKWWSQSDFFTAKVIGGLKPKNIEDDRQYLEFGNPGDLLLIKKDSAGAYAERGIVTVLQGKDWVIVSKAEKNRLQR